MHQIIDSGKQRYTMKYKSKSERLGTYNVFNPATFHWSVCTKPDEWVVTCKGVTEKGKMCLCLSSSTILFWKYSFGVVSFGFFPFHYIIDSRMRKCGNKYWIQEHRNVKYIALFIWKYRNENELHKWFRDTKRALV